MIDLDCWACREGVRHDERPEAVCVHSGECCGDAISERVALLVALWWSRRGHAPASPRPITDPIGAVWFGG